MPGIMRAPSHRCMYQVPGLYAGSANAATRMIPKVASSHQRRPATKFNFTTSSSSRKATWEKTKERPQGLCSPMKRGGVDSVPPAAKKVAVCGAGSSPEGAAARPGPWAEAVHASHKGLRKTIEDECILLDDSAWRASCEALPAASTFGFLAVIDGHGGANVAKLVRSLLPQHVGEALSLPTTTLNDKKSVKAAIRVGFRATCDAVVDACRKHSWNDGACVVAAVFVDGVVFIANLGDSKAVLSRQPPEAAPPHPPPKPCALKVHPFPCACAPLPTATAKVLTQDHTAVLERDRIEAAGGRVVDGRVNGALAVSRSFGDVALRAAGVTSDPDLRIAFKVLPGRDEFLLLGCDGVWAYAPQSAVDSVRNRLAAATRHAACSKRDCPASEHGWSLASVCAHLLEHGVSSLGIKDNATVVVARW